jgi:hypothetical protein
MKFNSLLTLALVGVLSMSPSLVRGQSRPEDQLVRDKLISLSGSKGGEPIDCGSTNTNKPDSKVSDCAKAAFETHKPFLFSSSNAIGMLRFGYGLAGDALGNVYVVEYDSRGLLNLGAGKNSKVFDDNHTRVTPCVLPIKLANSQSGLLVCILPVNEEESRLAAQQKPLETTLCAILEHPSAFNNKIVRIHGYASGTFEYSDLGTDGCSGSLWFAYGNGGGPPGLAIWITGGARPGAQDAEGKWILPVPVKLVRDANFDQFQKLMKARAEADARSFEEDADPLILYRVAATFTGRIDAVSDDVHAFHLKRKPTDRADFLGFGQMGLFDAQFVMQSVEDDSVLEKFPPEPNPKRAQPAPKP